MQNQISRKAFKNSPKRITKINSYFDIYDDLFLPYKNKEIIFVEIGVKEGGSLYMWREFFGPKARIIGVELNPIAKDLEKEGFEIYIGNQSDKNFWLDFIKSVGPVDIVLDDGGHTYEQQIITTEMLISNIKDGGMLVIEDCMTSYKNGFGPRKYSFIEYTKKLIDKINTREINSKKYKPDYRIWSIRIYNSIVAFIVNKKAVKIKPDMIIRNDNLRRTEDYRYNDSYLIKKLYNFKAKLNFLSKIVNLEKLINMIRNTIMIRKFSAKRYFK